MATTEAGGETERGTYTPYISIYLFGRRQRGSSESLVMLLLVCLAREREADGEKEKENSDNHDHQNTFVLEITSLVAML